MHADLFHETTSRTVEAGHPPALAREITTAGVAAAIVLALALASFVRHPAPETAGAGSVTASVRR